ncbi:hypothetical protein PG984_014150 [Apiospora sp. TS-2023a]
MATNEKDRPMSVWDLTPAQLGYRSKLRQWMDETFYDNDDQNWDDWVASCSLHVRNKLWLGGAAWSVNADYYIDEVHKTMWDSMHRTANMPKKDFPFSTSPPPKRFGQPFSREVLVWCYEKALETKQNYMLAKGEFRVLSDNPPPARGIERLALSRKVGGFPNDPQICTERGMIWIPNKGPVNFDKCVADKAAAIELTLKKAQDRICGGSFVLLYGDLPNGHKALLLELAPDADPNDEAVAGHYKRAYGDLLAWQLKLLRGQRIGLLAYLHEAADDRLQEGLEEKLLKKSIGFGSEDDDERAKLVHKYWTSNDTSLLWYQSSAVASITRIQAKRCRDKLEALVNFVNGDTPAIILPASGRQQLVKDKATKWVALHITNILSRSHGNTDEVVKGLIAFVREPDSIDTMSQFPRPHTERLELSNAAAIYSRQDRYDLIASRINDKTITEPIKAAFENLE